MQTKIFYKIARIAKILNEQSDPEVIQIDPNIVEQVYQLIVKDHSISRARK